MSSTKRSKSQKLKDKMKVKHSQYHQGAKSQSSNNPNRKLPEKSIGGQDFYRSKATIKRIKMYSEKPDL